MPIMPVNVRAAVYRAEDVVTRILDRQHEAPLIQIHGTTIIVPPERKFASIESIQTYVDSVLNLNWVKERWSRAAVPVSVRERRGQAKAHYEHWSAIIAIPPHKRGTSWAMREFVVLHELAHHLDESDEDHGSSFTGILCELISELLSPEAGFILRMAYYDEGVSVDN